MRFLAFLFFLIFIVFALWARWYFVCELRQKCNEVPEDVRLNTLQLTEGDAVILRDYDQFAFDSAIVSPRLNANNEAFLDTLAAIILADTNRNLEILGFHRESERDLTYSYFEALGVARADQIRQLLMERGVAEDRVKLSFGESADPDLKEPAYFDLYDPRNDPDANKRRAFTFTDIPFSDANFEFDSHLFAPTEPCIMYADSVKIYLDLYPDKELRIIGHTDFVGTESYNYELGIRRANSAKEYFRELGVTADISTESKGEKEPFATNDTKEGRAENRRVQFIIE